MNKIEHPTYGTCLSCTQGVRVDKGGFVRNHTRKVAMGSLLATVQCKGAGRRYEEYADLAAAARADSSETTR